MMLGEAHLPVGDGAIVACAVLAALHGWAWVTHTDGHHELSRRRTIWPCPECEQDLARV